jgi:MFS family permease
MKTRYRVTASRRLADGRHTGERTANPKTLRPTAAFVACSMNFVAVFIASGVPSPILLKYQQQWHFPPWMTTLAFGTYALALLAALVVAGSLSDRVGRRPVLTGSLVIQTAAMVVFAAAPNIEWVLAARVVQGAATGAATGAFTAAIVELAPAGRKRLAEIIAAVAGAAGLGVGALAAGIAMQASTHSVGMVFTGLAVFMAVGAVTAFLSPETVPISVTDTKVDLRPRVAVSQPARGEYRAAIPALIGIWMHGGLFMGLAPTMVRDIFHYDSGLIVGATTFASPAMTAVAALLLGRVNARALLIGGCAAIASGAGIILDAVVAHHFILLVFGGMIGGAGFGAGFSAVMRILTPLTDSRHRAVTFAAVYVVAYLSFGVPSIVAGAFIATAGIQVTSAGYAALTAAFALAGCATQLHRQQRNRQRRRAISVADPPPVPRRILARRRPLQFRRSRSPRSAEHIPAAVEQRGACPAERCSPGLTGS